MPVEQGLPWHPVAAGLAGQAIPFIVAASHVHALPSPLFWFPVPAVLVASPASLCPSSLSAVLALVPPGVAPAFCVSAPPPMKSRPRGAGVQGGAYWGAYCSFRSFLVGVTCLAGGVRLWRGGVWVAGN